MDILTVFQCLPLLISEIYIAYDRIKENEYAYLTKQTKLKQIEETKYFYEISNKILLQILTELELTSSKLKLPYTNDQIEKLIYSLNRNYNLTYFITKLIDYIGIENCHRLLLNIDTLTINYEEGIKKYILNELGSYDPIANSITLHHKNPHILSHEFLHAASTIHDRYYTYTGFSASNDFEKFFYGFNEGYTEILNKRIFDSKYIGYIANYTICLMLETMFDDKKELETAYFNNDFKIFIDKFLEYGSLEEMISILNTLDDFATTPFTNKEFYNALNTVYEIIKRNNELDKIKTCEEIINKHKQKEKSLIKRLARKSN